MKVLVAQSCLTFVTPCTAALQAPLSMGFSRQEYWSGFPFPSPGDLSDPELNPSLPHCRFFTVWTTREAFGLPCPPPGDLPNPGFKPRSPALQVDSLPTEPPGKPKSTGVDSLVGCHALLLGIFRSRNRIRVSCIKGGFFTSWATREAYNSLYLLIPNP